MLTPKLLRSFRPTHPVLLSMKSSHLSCSPKLQKSLTYFEVLNIPKYINALTTIMTPRMAQPYVTRNSNDDWDFLQGIS
jgi:hypothetical protein